MVAEIIRPPGDEDLIIRMPFAVDNRQWLEMKAGRDPGVRWMKPEKIWRVKRSKFERMIAALADRFGAVRVTQYGPVQGTCVSACWNGNPDRVWDCDCACAGSNHGTRQPHGKEVSPGLSIRTEYSEFTYMVRS